MEDLQRTLEIRRSMMSEVMRRIECIGGRGGSRR